MNMRRLNLGDAEMRRLVETFFGDAHEGDVSGIERWIVEEQRRKNPTAHQASDSTLCDEDLVEMCDVLWDMIREGILNPGGTSEPRAGWPQVRVTLRGAQIIANK